MREDTTKRELESIRDPRDLAAIDRQPFRVTPIDLQLPKEWTSGSVSELLEMIDGRSYLAKIVDLEFLESLSSVHQKYLQLVNMEPVDRSSIPRDRKVSGVYLFSEGDIHFYVGRTTNLRQRLTNHCGVSSAHNQAVFAFKLARHATNNKTASYAGAGTRMKLLEDPAFAQAFVDSKARVRNMKLRYVDEPDPLRQALLEIYTATLLKTEFNDFDTH
jgi:predicted GIY-YIG superfamily endonuclease